MTWGASIREQGAFFVVEFEGGPARMDTLKQALSLAATVVDEQRVEEDARLREEARQRAMAPR